MEEIITYADKLTTLVVILITGLLVYKGVLVLGREFNDMRDQRDYWKDIATTALKIGQKVVEQPRTVTQADADIRQLFTELAEQLQSQHTQEQTPQSQASTRQRMQVPPNGGL